MNLKLLSFLLLLYPRMWRARYGDEYRALLEQQPSSSISVLDVLHGALDAHLHPHFATLRRPSALSRLRASAITIFCAYAGFALAYGFLQKLADPQAPFDAVAAAHGEVGGAFTLIIVGFAVALLAILAGGLPIVAHAIVAHAIVAHAIVAHAIVAHAIAARRRDILSLCAVPLVALAALAVWTLLVARALFPAGHGASVPALLAVALALSWISLTGVALIASTAAVALAAARSDIDATLWRFALAPATVAAIAMAVTLAATVAWGAAVRAYAPSLFNYDLRAAWFVAVVAVMAVSTGAAGVSLKRGYAARATA